MMVVWARIVAVEVKGNDQTLKFILKLEPTEYSEKVEVSGEKKSQDDSNIFDLSSWTDGVPLWERALSEQYFLEEGIG